MSFLLTCSEACSFANSSESSLTHNIPLLVHVFGFPVRVFFLSRMPELSLDPEGRCPLWGQSFDESEPEVCDGVAGTAGRGSVAGVSKTNQSRSMDGTWTRGLQRVKLADLASTLTPLAAEGRPFKNELVSSGVFEDMGEGSGPDAPGTLRASLAHSAASSGGESDGSNGGVRNRCASASFSEHDRSSPGNSHHLSPGNSGGRYRLKRIRSLPANSGAELPSGAASGTRRSALPARMASFRVDLGEWPRRLREFEPRAQRSVPRDEAR